MYESFFGLREQPFSLLPDMRFLYVGEPQNVVLRVLERGLAARGGFTVITGDSGCGKTTLGNYLARSVGRGVPVESLSGAKGLDVDLLLQALFAPGTGGADSKRPEYLGLFSKHILAALASKQSLLLILDEAQGLGVETLAKLHELVVAGLEEDQLLYLILFGQSELKEQLAMPELDRIAGGIIGEARLAPLDVNETQAYIRHRLTVAGGNPELFTLGACARVFDHTSGVAGLINRLCELCLICGYDERRTSIEENTVDEAAARGIQGVPFWDAKALLSEPGDGGDSQTRVAQSADDEQRMPRAAQSANGPRHVTAEHVLELDKLERDLEQTAAFASEDVSGNQLAPRARRELEELKQAIATLPTPPAVAFNESQRADLRLVREEDSSHARDSEQTGTVVLPALQQFHSGTLPTIRLGAGEARESATGPDLPINPAARTGNRTKSRPLSGARLNKVLILGISLLFLAVIVLLVVDRVAVQSFVTGVATSIRAMYDTPQTEVVPPLETPGETESDSGSSSRVMEQPSTEIVRDATQSSSAESAPRAAEYWIALVYEAWAASELDLALYYLEQGLRDDPDNRQLQALAKAVRADLKTESP